MSCSSIWRETLRDAILGMPQQDYECSQGWEVILVPFAIGDNVYEVYGDKKIVEWTVHGYLIDNDSMYIIVGDGISLNAENMGKSFFGTREEAQDELNKRKGGCFDVRG